MKKAFLVPIIFLLVTSVSYAQNGVVNVASSFDVSTTADRLEKILTEKGMTIFKRVNHGEGAKNVGIDLRPTELVIFGNPKVGSPLMLCQQSVAIDLPQKALIWEDEKGKVWVSYNDPNYLQTRHDIQGCKEVIEKISTALAKFTQAASNE